MWEKLFMDENLNIDVKMSIWNTAMEKKIS